MTEKQREIRVKLEKLIESVNEDAHKLDGISISNVKNLDQALQSIKNVVEGMKKNSKIEWAKDNPYTCVKCGTSFYHFDEAYDKAIDDIAKLFD